MNLFRRGGVRARVPPTRMRSETKAVSSAAFRLEGEDRRGISRGSRRSMRRAGLSVSRSAAIIWFAKGERCARSNPFRARGSSSRIPFAKGEDYASRGEGIC
jgi:hypothetical protein